MTINPLPYKAKTDAGDEVNVISFCYYPNSLIQGKHSISLKLVAVCVFNDGSIGPVDIDRLIDLDTTKKEGSNGN